MKNTAAIPYILTQIFQVSLLGVLLGLGFGFFVIFFVCGSLVWFWWFGLVFFFHLITGFLYMFQTSKGSSASSYETLDSVTDVNI